MTWLRAAGRLLGALAKLAGMTAAYLLGKNRADRRDAERAAKHARDANRIDESVSRLSDAELYDELRRR